eukprot:COSAG01_NODE_35406_length_532_cov_1.143187_1_plen_42_part_10
MVVLVGCMGLGTIPAASLRPVARTTEFRPRRRELLAAVEMPS